jgi:hypothetical protein
VTTRRSRTFFVESYVPALDGPTAAALSAQLRAAVDELRREGRELEWLRSFALIDDETYVWMLAAGDVDDVVLVNERARLSYDHVVEVVTGEPLNGSSIAHAMPGSSHQSTSGIAKANDAKKTNVPDAARARRR